MLARVEIAAEALTKSDEKGEYRVGRELNKWGANSRRQDRPTMYFPIPGPNGEDVYPIRNDGSEGRWRRSKQKMLKAVLDGDVEFQERPDATFIVYEKVRAVAPRTKPYRSWLTDTGTTADGTKEIKQVFGEKLFDYPKPLGLLEQVLKMATGPTSIVLDSFAGSGTTGHAVLKLNAQDGGRRQCLLIELEDYAETITAERLRRVVGGYGAVAGTGGGFGYYTLGPALFAESGELNEAVGLPALRQYLYYTETRQPLPAPPAAEAGAEAAAAADTPALLGCHGGAAYYFHYAPDAATTLDHDFLSTVRTRAEQYVIYADNCLLPADFLRQARVVFKKIPRDLTRF